MRHYTAPHHLAAVCNAYDRLEHAPLRILLSAPPQHGKTQTVKSGIVRYLLRHPDHLVAYISYSAERARSVSKEIRELALDCGIRLRDDSSSAGEWRTAQGGGLRAVGIEGGLTGYDIRHLVIDDPYKDAADAESLAYRQKLYDWFDSVARNRIDPKTSIIIFHTRWHTDDLIGRLLKEGGWEHLNIPAINDLGEALWPEKKPLWFLQQFQANEYFWWSQYMGEPRPRGAHVFNDVRYYRSLPKSYRVAIGIDLAYTSKTHSDYCVAVVLAEADGIVYVLDVIREQSTPPEFAKRLRALRASYPGAQWLWHTSTTEQGLADLMRVECGFPLLAEVIKNGADKFVRAQPVAAAWNEGRVLLPSGEHVGDRVVAPHWVADFVAEICSFTGVGDRHDDQVDAFGSAFEMLARSGGITKPKTIPSQFTKFGGNPFAPAGEVKWGDRR